MNGLKAGSDGGQTSGAIFRDTKIGDVGMLERHQNGDPQLVPVRARLGSGGKQVPDLWG